MVVGCPDSLIESSIRSAAIEFCEKSGAYQTQLDPITTIPKIYEYDLDTPRGTAIHKVMWVTHLGKDLEPISTTLLEQREPKWRSEDNYSVPKYFVKQNSSSVWLVPVPNIRESQSTIVRVQLKPTHTSTACDDSVMSEYRDTIVNGAIFRLLRIPNKDWSDLAGAQVYAALFGDGIDQAKRRASHADENIARKVNYGGIPQRTRHAKRGWRSGY